MPFNRKSLIVVCTLVTAVVITVTGLSLRRSFFYPAAPSLPPVVEESTDSLIKRLDAVLKTQAPIVMRNLNPGLSDAQISTLEFKGRFSLNNELRSLYRWRNGMATSSIVGLLPGKRFLPLDEIAARRVLDSQQLRNETVQQKAATNVFAGHRKEWLQIFDDGAGDGYFYDPTRSEVEGAFFYHFAETGDYVWFPSVRNFLLGTIKCYETKAVKASSDGKDIEEDYDRTQKIWEQLATFSDSES